MGAVIEVLRGTWTTSWRLERFRRQFNDYPSWQFILERISTNADFLKRTVIINRVR